MLAGNRRGGPGCPTNKRPRCALAFSLFLFRGAKTRSVIITRADGMRANDATPDENRNGAQGAQCALRLAGHKQAAKQRAGVGLSAHRSASSFVCDAAIIQPQATMKLLIASILLAASATIHLASGAEFGRRPALRALASDDTDETVDFAGKSPKGKSPKGKSSKGSRNDGGYPNAQRQVSEWTPIDSREAPHDK